MPRRSILPERLVPSLPGIFGAERVESERIRLANEGQPLRVRPVGVTHSANMADPEKWVNPLRGYAYDSFNKDAILRLANAMDRSHYQKVKGIKAVLKDRELQMIVDSAQDISLELGLLKDKEAFFEEVFGIRLVLRRKGRA